MTIKYPNSLLYKISGNGLKKSSYLLGTMHMICAEDFEIKQKVMNALARCNQYFMEVDLGSVAEMDVMQDQSSVIENFSEDLSEKQKAELNQILIDQYGLSLQDAEQLPPVALINKMTTDAIGCEDFKIAEIELLQLAQQSGLQTGGLETAMQQMKIAEKVFDGKEIFRQLKSAADYKELFARMIKAYHSENLFDLAAFVTDKRFMSRKAYNILVIDRNKRWAKKIPKLISETSTFVAVGAGHLPGEKGVLTLLKDQGWNVNPVYR